MRDVRLKQETELEFHLCFDYFSPSCFTCPDLTVCLSSAVSCKDSLPVLCFHSLNSMVLVDMLPVDDYSRFSLVSLQHEIYD